MQESRQPNDSMIQFACSVLLRWFNEYDYDAVCKDINELIEISQQYDDMATVAKMKQIVPEYKSNNSIYEKLDQPSA